MKAKLGSTTVSKVNSTTRVHPAKIHYIMVRLGEVPPPPRRLGQAINANPVHFQLVDADGGSVLAGGSPRANPILHAVSSSVCDDDGAGGGDGLKKLSAKRGQ